MDALSTLVNILVASSEGHEEKRGIWEKKEQTREKLLVGKSLLRMPETLNGASVVREQQFES